MKKIAYILTLATALMLSASYPQFDSFTKADTEQSAALVTATHSGLV